MKFPQSHVHTHLQGELRGALFPPPFKLPHPGHGGVFRLSVPRVHVQMLVSVICQLLFFCFWFCFFVFKALHIICIQGPMGVFLPFFPLPPFCFCFGRGVGSLGFFQVLSTHLGTEMQFCAEEGPRAPTATTTTVPARQRSACCAEGTVGSCWQVAGPGACEEGGGRGKGGGHQDSPV